MRAKKRLKIRSDVIARVPGYGTRWPRELQFEIFVSCKSEWPVSGNAMRPCRAAEVIIVDQPVLDGYK